SSLRSFYKFLERENKVDANPFMQISLPKREQVLPGFLYKEELEKLFQISDVTKPLGQRNQAILETLYATGMRVSECQSLTLYEIDNTIVTMIVTGKERKKRYVPFGSFADTALNAYINDGRQKLLATSGDPTKSVFLNARGHPLTTIGTLLIL